jgi:hypothetical protein
MATTASSFGRNRVWVSALKSGAAGQLAGLGRREDGGPLAEGGGLAVAGGLGCRLGCLGGLGGRGGALALAGALVAALAAAFGAFEALAVPRRAAAFKPLAALVGAALAGAWFVVSAFGMGIGLLGGFGNEASSPFGTDAVDQRAPACRMLRQQAGGLFPRLAEGQRGRRDVAAVDEQGDFEADRFANNRRLGDVGRMHCAAHSCSPRFRSAPLPAAARESW